MRESSVTAVPRRQRCAIYIRKSSDEGLDMEFNSLRESARARFEEAARIAESL
jgi:hypothetical protein